MLAVKNIHVLVSCKDAEKLPEKLELYYDPGRPAAEIASDTKLVLPGGRVLLADARVDMILFGRRRRLDSVRELHGAVLGLYGPAEGNPAGVSRISFFAEDAAFNMELREDGSLSECAWHCMGPHWDFPGYKNPDGTRFRAPMYADQPWTKTDATWGFTRYSWDETH